MKYLFILFLFFYSFSSFAMNYKIKAFQFNGTELSESPILLLNDSCLFKIYNQNEQEIQFVSSEWDIYHVITNDSIPTLAKAEKQKSALRFKVDKELYIYNKNNLKRFESKTDSSIFFKSIILFKGELAGGEMVEVSFPIYLNLLPSRPVFTLKSITWNSITKDSTIFENGILSFILLSERNNYKQNLVMHYFKDEYPVSFYNWFLEYEDIEKMLAKVSFGENSEGFSFCCTNDFGTVSSNAIYWIKNLLSYADISSPVEDCFSFYPNPVNSILYIQNKDEEVHTYSIINSAGLICKQFSFSGLSSIDLSDLQAGLLLIKEINLKKGSNAPTYKLIKK